MAIRTKALGDVFSWVRRSLRTYLSFQYMCEYHNLPYLQTQMVNLYEDYIKASNGIIKTYHDIENYKDVMAILPAGSYSNQEKDNNIETLLKLRLLVNKSNLLFVHLERKFFYYPEKILNMR